MSIYKEGFIPQKLVLTICAVVALTATQATVGTTATVRKPPKYHSKCILEKHREAVAFYRNATWRWQSKMNVPKTRTSNSERKSTSCGYLGWTVRLWRVRAKKARLHAIKWIHRSVHEIARQEAWRLGIRGGEWSCLESLVSRENGNPPHKWNPFQYNGGGSGAYGLPQALPGSKMSSEGDDWASNPATQIRWMISYNKSRYGSQCSADYYQRTHNFY